MKKVFPKFFIPVIFFSLYTISFCQTDSSGSSTSEYKIRVVPGKQYEVNWINEIFSGSHWRSLWLTKIEADVLDMNKFAGGLNPLKVGGGLQTKSLRLRGSDDNEYKFRSIDKFPYKSLRKEWQNSYYADLLQDQVSIGLPVSSLIVYPLMKDVGILAVQPRIVVLPDSERLGSFRKELILGPIKEIAR